MLELPLYPLSMETSRAFSIILGNLGKKMQKISCQPNNSKPVVIINQNFIDEEPNNLSCDIVDNWSIDVIEELDHLSDELIQQEIGCLMKKYRSTIKLINKSSILMNYVLPLKNQSNIQVYF